MREERERTDRIVVRVHKIEGRLDEAPERVRLSVRKGTAPPVGTFIEVKARLNPPLRPLRPGGYDFSRDLYFQRIGATGFVQGAIKIAEAPVPPDGWLRYATLITQMRGVIDARIRASLSGDDGAIASALLTGTRDAISTPVNDAMYISGLGHVLSISGYHMALVAGVVFFAVRALLALIPVLAMRYAIKKWAAFAALLAAFFYLLLSGAEVATQRSFIMTGDRAGRRDGRPLGADVAQSRARGARRDAARARGGGASELPDVVCGDARADRRPTSAAFHGCGPAPTRRSARASRCGAGARSSR